MEQSPTFRNCLSCLLHVPIHFLLCKMETSAPTCGRDFPFLSGNIARLLAQLPGRWAWPHCWVLAKGIGVWRRRSNASLVWKKKSQKPPEDSFSLSSLFYTLSPCPGPPGKPGVTADRSSSAQAPECRENRWPRGPHTGLSFCRKRRGVVVSHGDIQV